MSQARPAPPILDEALRRVPDADGRNPWDRPDRIHGAPRLAEVRSARRRYGVRWPQRTVTALAPTQTRVTVPFIGPEAPPDLGYRLSQRLATALSSDRALSAGPFTVAAHLSRTGSTDLLTLVITGPLGDSGRPFDSAHLNAPLELALRVLSHEDETFRMGAE